MNNELINRIVSSIILIPLVIFFVFKGSYFFNFFILICLLISVYEWNLMTKNKQYMLPGIIFLSLSFYTAYYLRMQTNEGFTYFITIILICISSDIGGYIFGKIFKGPKLTKISPKKTYAGSIGSYFCSVLFLLFFLNNIDYIYDLAKLEIANKNVGINNFVLAIIISTVSQLGDIIVSYFKRKSNFKNTGNIIPGHGGLLDRIDGMIFAFPSAYLIYIIY